MTSDERLWKTFNKALGKYNLIDEGDKILVALSGGKDSLCLLELLARRSKILKPRFSLEAIHVRMDNVHYESDTNYLQSFCDRLSVPLHVVTTRFEFSSKKPPCFLCSWERRKQLFNKAQALGCSKIAFGHHQDDLIQTALMNLTYIGRFTTMPPKLRMKKMPITIIRPLCLCNEEYIRDHAELHHYQKQKKVCTYEDTTSRKKTENIFMQLRKLNPEVRYSIWNALENDGNITDSPKIPF